MSSQSIPLRLSQTLVNHCRATFAESDAFASDNALRSVFITHELAPFRNGVPAGDSPAERASLLIAYLLGKRLSNGESALPYFIAALRDRYDPSDALHADLQALRETVALELSLPRSDTDAGARGGSSTRPSAEPPGPIASRWALLIGVNNYVDGNIASLRFCVNDAETLADTLQKAGYSVVTLHSEDSRPTHQPTRNNIEEELARMCQTAGRDDLLLVYFSGHGILIEGQPYLLPPEARRLSAARQALSLAEVERQMRASQARRRVLILDACHTGVDIGRDVTDSEFIRYAYDQAEGFALIAGSTSQQKALERDKLEHGIFTYFLLEGLTGKADAAGKGFVTVNDLATYTVGQVKRWNRENGGLVQEPTVRAEGLGDMIVLDLRSARNQPAIQ